MNIKPDFLHFGRESGFLSKDAKEKITLIILLHYKSRVKENINFSKRKIRSLFYRF